MSTLADLTKQALALPVEERIVLAQRVWESIGNFENPDVEKAWMDEAYRRSLSVKWRSKRCFFRYYYYFKRMVQ